MVDFCYIGPSRAGSTWIWANLDRHPDIVFPDGKITHFWDEHYKGGQVYGRTFEKRPVDWYLNKLASQPGKVVGDVTESYAPMDREKIEAFKHYCPDTKILYCLRNPLDIAWSACKLVAPRHIGKLETAKIEDVRTYLVGDLQLCSTANYEDKNCDIATNLQTWREVFGEEQVMAYWFEDLSKRPKELLQEICTFIGADPSFYDSVPSEQLEQKANEGAKTRLRQDIKELVKELHMPKVDKAEQLTGVNLDSWRSKWD